MSTSTAARRTERAAEARDARPWSRSAACAGKTKLFFAPPSEGPDARRHRELRASMVCAVCPVITQCRTWAREHGEFGYWGGESEDDRAAAGYRTRMPRSDRRSRQIGPHRVA